MSLGAFAELRPGSNICKKKTKKKFEVIFYLFVGIYRHISQF
jgi:hypothetical protein